MYFSQCNEDEYLNEHYLHNKRDGTYIELGALDGVLYSNTKFYQDQLGWKGVLIEPHRYAFSLLQKNRPRKGVKYEHNEIFTSVVNFDS